MVSGDAPLPSPALHGPIIRALYVIAEESQRVGPSDGLRNRDAKVVDREWRVPGHTRTLVRMPDGKASVCCGFVTAGEPGIEPGLIRPKRIVLPLHHSPLHRDEARETLAE